MYKGWPRITEQVHITYRQCLYRQAIKAHVFPGSLAFQWALTGVDWPNNGRDIAMCISPLLRPYGEKAKKNFQKNNFICHPLQTHYLRTRCLWLPAPSLDSQMPVFLDNIDNNIDVGRSHNCSQWTTPWFKFYRLLSVYKGFMPPPNCRII